MDNQTLSTLNQKQLIYIILSSFFIALGVVLPFLTANVAFLGARFLPMHVPVLLCGFICGWKYGLIVGLITPMLRSLLVGMPPLYPTAFIMTFELGAYGLVAGLLYRKLPKITYNIFVALMCAMIIGRIVWGLTSLMVYTSAGLEFTLPIYLAGAFVNAIPGIIFQLIFIPT
ncbi:MAG: ECF transporter S component, partial [Acholeplasmataceae bacterium]|nr:ECF transporter S component [Acholeplasmataceae bacterium]